MVDTMDSPSLLQCDGMDVYSAQGASSRSTCMYHGDPQELTLLRFVLDLRLLLTSHICVAA
jgi:hypothetical protein